MKFLAYFTFLCCFIACENSPTSPTYRPTPKSSLLKNAAVTSDSLIKPAQLMVQDRHLYDSTFLIELVQSNFAEVFSLQNEILMIDQDTVAFPTDLLGEPSDPFGRKFDFKGQQDDKTYHLHVSPINYTTLDYRFEWLEKKDTLEKIEGQANLGTFFFLGDETDTDDQTGHSYFASEYSETIEDCIFSIRIGRDEGDLKAKVIRFCEDAQQKNMELHKVPTLREE